MAVIYKQKKMAAKIMDVPFVGILVLLLLLAFIFADFALAIGWLLKILEVHSIFDRIVPTWTASYFFLGSIVASIASWLLAKLFQD